MLTDAFSLARSYHSRSTEIAWRPEAHGTMDLYANSSTALLSLRWLVACTQHNLNWHFLLLMSSSCQLPTWLLQETAQQASAMSGKRLHKLIVVNLYHTLSINCLIYSSEKYLARIANIASLPLLLTKLATMCSGVSHKDNSVRGKVPHSSIWLITTVMLFLFQDYHFPTKSVLKNYFSVCEVTPIQAHTNFIEKNIRNKQQGPKQNRRILEMCLNAGVIWKTYKGNSGSVKQIKLSVNKKMIEGITGAICSS